LLIAAAFFQLLRTRPRRRISPIFSAVALAVLVFLFIARSPERNQPNAIRAPRPDNGPVPATHCGDRHESGLAADSGRHCDLGSAIEHQRGIDEIHAVLGTIGPSLGFIPFEYGHVYTKCPYALEPDP
jgi:hypothetical protein